MWERRGGRTGGSFLGLMEIYGVLCFALYYNAVRGRMEKDHEMDSGQQGFLPEIARNGKHLAICYGIDSNFERQFLPCLIDMNEKSTLPFRSTILKSEFHN